MTRQSCEEPLKRILSLYICVLLVTSSLSRNKIYTKHPDLLLKLEIGFLIYFFITGNYINLKLQDTTALYQVGCRRWEQTSQHSTDHWRRQVQLLWYQGKNDLPLLKITYSIQNYLKMMYF